MAEMADMLMYDDPFPDPDWELEDDGDRELIVGDGSWPRPEMAPNGTWVPGVVLGTRVRFRVVLNKELWMEAGSSGGRHTIWSRTELEEEREGIAIQSTVRRSGYYTYARRNSGHFTDDGEEGHWDHDRTHKVYLVAWDFKAPAVLVLASDVTLIKEGE